MKFKNCASDAIVAAWAISSPSAIAGGVVLPNSPGWKEIKGHDTCIYLRLSKSAACALAKRLVEAVESGEPSVVRDGGKPEGTVTDEAWDHQHGFFVHPLGASLSIEIHEMPTIDELLQDKKNGKELIMLSPVDGIGVFKR